jgi:hypothetical protein
VAASSHAFGSSTGVSCTQQVPEAQSAELQSDAVACETQLLTYYENDDMPEVVRVYEELIRQGHEPSAEAASSTAQAYREIGQAEQAASVVDALLKQGHQPEGMQQLNWSYIYYMADRLEAARDVLQQAVQASPKDDAIRVGFLCDIYSRLGEWTSVPAALAQRRALSSADADWLRTLGWCNQDSADADDFKFKAVMQAVNGLSSQALITVREAHSRGVELTQSVYMLLMIVCCVDAKYDCLLEVLSTMASLGINLNVYQAKSVAQACAAHGSSTLNKLMVALQGVAPLTTQCCAMAIAAALELKDINAAIRWFDMMHQQGIQRDRLIYAAIAAECYMHRYHDCMHVLEEAKAVGLLSLIESADGDSSARKLRRSIEPAAETNFRTVQSLVRAWIREGSSTIDLTVQGGVPQSLKLCKNGVLLAVAALRLLLREVAAHKAGDTWYVARAGLMVTNYWIFDDPFTDTLEIKFRTGSPCGDALARELRAELQSGAISVSSNADDDTTTYSIHTPGLRVYCADSKRKTIAEGISKLRQQRQGEQ